MNFFIILICKWAQFILKKLGRGSSFPGDLALKFNKNILGYFKISEHTKIICVTGTTGKTSISSILAEIYRKEKNIVGHNAKGSNLEPGVVSLFLENSTITGKIKSDFLVVELDERFVKRVLPKITPDYFIINNLSRDQLARNGHFDIIFKEIEKNIHPDTHLILNGDDPLIYKFSLNHTGKLSFYGLEETKFSTKKATASLDMAYCPKCHKKLIFDFYHYGNLGDYHCPNKDFNRPKIEYLARLNEDNSFEIDAHNIKMPNDAIYNVYNLSASYIVAKLTDINTHKIIDALNSLSLKIKRLDTFNIGDKEGVLLTSKNETPMSYNQSLEFIDKQKEKKTVVIGFNRISGRYDLKDLSWLYDINFELLNNESIEKIICIGPFANDISLRLKYADINQDKISIDTDSDNVLNIVKNDTQGKIYCVFYFDLEKQFKNLMQAEVIK